MQASVNVKNSLAIGLGGVVGSLFRYLISLIIIAEGFPFATLCVNLMGCFILSYILHNDKVKKILSPPMFASLSVGLIGSFTTFSTFSVETIELWNKSQLLAVLYCIISVLGGLFFCFLGFKSSLTGRKRGNV
ncbi:MAG: fluoride efflux transporter CrcB [Bacillota bacterium]|uniref:Fluoride-specific ion channel FluC n=1 Tax=Virgibacillus salarius TaxID=447199 RepID=A0A941IAN1_9BACI|nr:MULTISPECIES: fluoride efflux transporter CrcB [Bacillaceae]NAZ07183.1 fluoride efflux transporter CrcB [Agaribacter marinus]MBR7794460.1 fluoride efflux transporter CrcB [Virgibacillus salarius]MCC2248795.1 fluoride efflux transporter CrcB [Virgibacillus sp. AGTR]MDY7043254.1 fluoride efflux transporter CrcB [Virgibacillus sp. M23]QRZ17916.1 fluoride efflux transporter CrcB [Virgibacillus sp. AGTR]